MSDFINFDKFLEEKENKKKIFNTKTFTNEFFDLNLKKDKEYYPYRFKVETFLYGHDTDYEECNFSCDKDSNEHELLTTHFSNKYKYVLVKDCEDFMGILTTKIYIPLANEEELEEFMVATCGKYEGSVIYSKKL